MHALAQLLWPRSVAPSRPAARTPAPVAERILHDERIVVPTGDHVPAQDPCAPWWFDQALA